MILRRLSENLKAQNWTAIVVELVILVLGVFLGLQAQEWSTRRQTQAAADDYTRQLMVDFKEELWFRTFLFEYYTDAGRNGERVLADLDGTAPLDDEQFLVAAFRATQYIQWYANQSTYAQMVATGTVDLIRDAQVRKQATVTFGTTIIADIKQEGAASEYRNAFRGVVPLDVQRKLAKACGDHVVPRDDLAKLVGILDYPCTPGLDRAKAAASVQAIKRIDGLAEKLRLRVMQIDTRRGALWASVQNLGGTAQARRVSTPARVQGASQAPVVPST